MKNVYWLADTCLDNSEMQETKPLYMQLAYQLELTITRTLKPGDMLDSEMLLAQKFGVNRHTVRHAIDQLVRAGIVVKQQGKGTQVVSNQIEYLLNPGGKFTKNLNELGRTAHAVLLSQRVVDFSQVPLTVQRAFSLTDTQQTQVVELVTQRFMENVPVCLIHHYLSSTALPGVQLTYDGGSLHQHIAEQFSVELERSQMSISAKLANASESVSLKCAIDSPLVVLQSINRIKNSTTVVEVSVSHSRPDRLQYQINFKGEQ